ncbi:Cytidine deaminase [Pseudolycoriella hygida]|uniref:Cytidine deaminase n=1 Tax=Pseudolycoriella hygida TaxID=35572 RepID=A0A9Q0S1N3_9DIPT|nr:Cytidine deaminase [Pseudolycoriella hygida]
MNQVISEDLIFSYDGLEPDVKELIDAAIKTRKNAYTPYSNFKVGSALRTTTGEIFTGCNVENAAYSPTVCAERTAICKAVSEGYREIAAIAVIGFQEHSFTTPCGVCRQFISEFCHTDIPVYVTKPVPDRVLVTSIYKLLPINFVPVL